MSDRFEPILDEDGNDTGGFKLRNPYDELRRRVDLIEKRLNKLEGKDGTPVKVGNDEKGSPELEAALAEKQARHDAKQAATVDTGSDEENVKAKADPIAPEKPKAKRTAKSDG